MHWSRSREACLVIVLDGPEAVLAAQRSNLGRSDWLDIDGARIEAWRDSTGHDDTALLALSLTNYFLPLIVEVQGFSAGVNYGTGAVVFGPQIAAGDRVRADVELVEVTELPAGVQTKMRITVEIDGSDDPACVVHALSRWLD